jgi:hypothetical protein
MLSVDKSKGGKLTVHPACARSQETDGAA